MIILGTYAFEFSILGILLRL